MGESLCFWSGSGSDQYSCEFQSLLERTVLTPNLKLTQYRLFSASPRPLREHQRSLNAEGAETQRKSVWVRLAVATVVSGFDPRACSSGPLRYDLTAVLASAHDKLKPVLPPLIASLLLLAPASAPAHDIITTKVTFDREIIRLFNSHCVSCHRAGGTAFSLATYKDARPWAKAIGEEVLQRRMPPWGAVKGFGDFRNDKGLTEEQLELIVDWEEGGAPEGEEKDLPPTPKISIEHATAHSAKETLVSGDLKLTAPLKLDGLWPKTVAANESFQITAEFSDGSVEPLLWLRNFKEAYGHPFLLRHPLDLPAGTVIRGIPADASVMLIPGKSSRKK